MERENVKKFAFVGAMGAGKTTLLNEYRNLLINMPGVVFVPDAGRIFLKARPEIDRRVPDNHVEIQNLVLKQEQEAHRSSAKLVICDGSVITAPAHILAYGNNTKAEELIQRVLFWLPTYSEFFLLNLNDVVYENDEVRIESGLFRSKLHDAFIILLTRLGLPYRLLSGDLQERIKKVNEFIGWT
ncbi:ATP-binding protein [Candidatus Roizmanbacteria bacterium]|nr:ATP-binding protein [Candidatus Roizmanbacteria bacterium]